MSGHRCSVTHIGVPHSLAAATWENIRTLPFSSPSGDSLEAATIGEWATTTGSASLKSLVDVVVKHISGTCILLKDLLGLIRSWILQETEAVAKDEMSVLSRLIMSGGALL